MAEITKLNITELDFDAIKNNLKDYFASQSEFSDHDFEGSAISVMLDVLSYNGLNVYDIVKKDNLIIIDEALKLVEERLL